MSRPPSRQKADPLVARNRFAGGGVAVLGEDFTDREVEREELARSARTPRGHVVVSGLRRMGKTSVLLAVRDELEKAGDPVVYVDLWSASTLEDMTTRLATAASAALGRRWKDLIARLGQGLKLRFEIAEAPGGAMIPVPTVELRDAPPAEQRSRLVAALDLLEELARKERAHLTVILDEFQEIERLGSGETKQGGVSAMRQLRAAIQHHRHVTYLFAGSDRRLIARLHEQDGGALYNLGRKYEIGPIDTQHFARWIETQLRRMGIDGKGMGIAIIRIAGPRTRDVRTLAEDVAELARETAVVTEKTISDAMLNIVRQRRWEYEREWKGLTALQQNVLRAVAHESTGWARAAVLQQFALGNPSRVSKTIDTLCERTTLLREGDQVLFDDPFYRAWVIVSTLPDVGLRLPVTHVPAALPSS